MQRAAAIGLDKLPCGLPVWAILRPIPLVSHNSAATKLWVYSEPGLLAANTENVRKKIQSGMCYKIAAVIYDRTFGSPSKVIRAIPGLGPFEPATVTCRADAWALIAFTNSLMRLIANLFAHLRSREPQAATPMSGSETPLSSSLSWKRLITWHTAPAHLNRGPAVVSTAWTIPHPARSTDGRTVGRRMRGAGASAMTLCLVLLGSCTGAPRTPYTEADESASVPFGPYKTRFWADSQIGAFQSDARHAVAQKGQPFTYLALSGGGGGGAFGAGILNGWTETGKRPEFTVVSGVSVGALIAPFAFLGPTYDDKLKQLYTDGEAERLISHPDPIGALFGPGLFGRGELRGLVAKYIDLQMFDAIAREDQKGRRLLVVTTNLDAQRAMIWDMGAIASIGGPKAFKLFGDVLAASASVPVVFAPQLIDVEAHNRLFQEMHVDGAVSTPIYTLPDAYLLGGKSIASHQPRPSIYIIENGRIEAGFEVVPNQSEAIAAETFSIMNRAGVQAVVAQTYKAARRDGIGFNLTFVGRDFPETSGTGFETDTMRQLYLYGYQKARAGSFWLSEPPQVTAAVATANTPAP
jgi:predicted patatin/cPLA2 family phospholipase